MKMLVEMILSSVSKRIIERKKKKTRKKLKDFDIEYLKTKKQKMTSKKHNIT